jgi:hypothetical protein
VGRRVAHRLFLGCLLRGLGLRVAALEALDPAAGVNELLLAGVEGVSVRTDLGADLAHGASRLERVPARTVDVRDLVLGVDALFHGFVSLGGTG